jgi:2-polyprenyl-6-methoxyphenol hydroxylase-like FAD-dependent oxidoreductase
MTGPYDVCIRGDGIVGRTLALHLAAKRLRVALVAQPGPAPAHSDVRAYALSPASRQLLQAVRCWPDASSATPVTAMQVQSDDDAHQQVQFQTPPGGAEALNWIVDVPSLERLLADALRFQPLIALHDTAPPATLLAVCEGRMSSTSQALGVEFDVTTYTQWALAGRVRCERPHQQVARQWFCQGNVVALLPMEGANGTLCALVWSLAPEQAAHWQAASADAFCGALFEATHGSLGDLSLEGERKVWPLQAAQAQRWSGTQAHGDGSPQSWVLLGDAAHTVHPLAGQGLNLGLGDVAKLVATLDQRPYWRNVGDPKLLRAYERARKAEFALVGGSGDSLQRIFSQTHPAWQAVRRFGMHAFDRSPVKPWVTRRAMGAAPDAPR